MIVTRMLLLSILVFLNALAALSGYNGVRHPIAFGARTLAALQLGRAERHLRDAARSQQTRVRIIAMIQLLYPPS